MNEMSLAELEGLDERELYLRLGLSLLGEGLGVSPDDQGEAEEFGRRWFRDRLELLRAAVCGSSYARQFTGNSMSDNLLDAATIQELIGDVVHDPFKAGIVAVLVTRIGLSTFCLKADRKA